MSERLTAHFEHREYFFKFLNKVAADRSSGAQEELQIDMYGTLYTFIKKDGKWMNKPGNKMNMAAGLIEAVMDTLRNQEQ